MIFWLLLKLEISYRVVISWRILVCFRGFLEDYIYCMVKYLSLHYSSFALRYFLTQMATPQCTVWHTPCFLSLGYGAVAVLCYLFFWRKSPNGDTASNFWRKKIPLFLKKNSPSLPCCEQSVSLLATDGLNDPVQKCRQLRRNLSGSVWGYSPVLLQYKKEKKKKKRKRLGCCK